MPGRFNKLNPPKRPGAYTNFEAAQRLRPDPPLQGVVAVPITHNWGPIDTVVACDSVGEFQDVFGDTQDEGFRAVYQAFKGEAIEGRGGAARVLVQRIGGSAAAKASKVVQNTAPANAITLTAKYEGTLGNTLHVDIVANAASPGTKNDLVLRLGGAAGIEIERFAHVKTDITALAADINARSAWVTAGSVTSGTALLDPASGDFTGGNSGTTLVAGDYTAALDLFESHRFAIFTTDLDGTANSSILTSIKTWATDPDTGLNANGKRFEVVVGGGVIGSPDTMASALTRSASLNQPDIVNVGGFRVRDTKILDATTGLPLELSPSTLAPRIAGILAARGETASATFARLGDIEVIVAPTEDEILSALEGGVVTIAQDSHPAASVRLEKGITTYTDDTDAIPLELYSPIKFVVTMHGIEMDITEFAENNVIGRLPVNDATREFLVGAFQAQMKRREAQGVIQVGSTVAIDQNPPPTDQDDFVNLEYTANFGRSLEQVRNTVVVG